MSYLEADVYYRKKDEKKTGQFLDRRKFRSQQTEDEKTLKNIMESFETFGISDSVKVSNQLMTIKNIHQLNKNLLVLVYTYFENKNFDLQRVTENFEEDFQEVLNTASKLNLFKKLFDKKLFYEFRQDFICYLFILYNFNIELEESTESEDFYDDGYSFRDEDVYDEIQEPLEDRKDYREE